MGFELEEIPHPPPTTCEDVRFAARGEVRGVREVGKEVDGVWGGGIIGVVGQCGSCRRAGGEVFEVRRVKGEERRVKREE
ncbi:MAG: hypothetical protein JSV99_11180 [Planctomycetota bacterium]|nr:MAG: hypothetical protein JSV99_11180 [Planctomycetota bacterium]